MKKKVHLLLNFVDLNRFKCRPPLPEHPQRALAFSNLFDEISFNILKKACIKAGIKIIDNVGMTLGTAHSSPEMILEQYDLVFAKGRAAHEALAVGAAVISCDGRGSMVTLDNLHRQRISNFGLMEKKDYFTIESVMEEIKKYNALDAWKVCAEIRKTADKDLVINDLINLYHEIINEYHANYRYIRELEMKAISDYLRWIKSAVRKTDQLYYEINKLTLESANKIDLSQMRWRDILNATLIRLSKYF